jgi:tetratricopeptide (TPR) repeat protein
MGDIRKNRPAPAASGTLAKTPLLHLLIYAFEKKLDGTIELSSPDRRTAVLLFVAGEPAKAQVDGPSAYLGQVLTDLGYLSERVCAQTLAELMSARAGAPVLHGQLLLTKGVIDPASLDAGLREQLVRKLRHVAAMPPETTYAYYHDFDALHGWGGEVTRGFDPMPLLWGLLRESTPRAHVDAALARVRGSSIRIAKTADLGRLGLAAAEHAGAEQLRTRRMTVSEFPHASGLTEQDARLLTYLLLVTKQVDVIATGQPPPRTSVPPNSFVPPRASVPPRPSTPPLTPSSLTSPAALAKSLFPPGHVSRSKPPPGLAPELAERWLAIVDRARTIDRADYFAMLDLARDATREEAQSSYFALAKKWHPDRLPPELSPVRDSCSRVFARMSEAYATLTDEEKHARYMKLLDEGSGSPEMQETVAKAVEAASDFQRAEVCFKRHDYVQAEALCRKAVAADATQADYLAMLAWLVSLKPESQAAEKVAECVQMLDRAVTLSDRCERGYFWRGMLNKRLGKTDAAFRDFRRAFDLNPRNIDAAREVRLYNMRGGRPSRSSMPPASPLNPSPVPGKIGKVDEKAGILGRFFKK